MYSGIIDALSPRPEAVVISDSSLVWGAVSKGLTSSFTEVKRHFSLEFLETSTDWESAVVICDVTDPGHAISKLSRLSAHSDISRIMLLLRSTQEPNQFLPLLGQVGAIIPSHCSVDEVALAAQLLGHGLQLTPSGMLTPLAISFFRKSEDSVQRAQLTVRERAVLALIAEGRSNKIIARTLDLSDSTIRVHVRSILRKLKLQNRTQAALLATRQS